MQVDGRVLYEGWSEQGRIWICVTTGWCTVNKRRYPMSELELLGFTRGRPNPLRSRRFGRLLAIMAALALVGYAIRSGWTKDLSIAVAATAVATVAITALPATLLGALRRPFQIWAQNGNSDVLLFETCNQEQHGQVARALIRARETASGDLSPARPAL